jgi:hypothetical protein
VRANPSPRYISAEELRRARGAGATELTAVTGDRFTVADDDVVEIVVNDPDEVHVVASLDSFRKDAAAWSKALSDVGLVKTDAEPIAIEGQQVTFVVAQPGALAQTDAKLVAARLYGAKVVPIVRRNQHTWKELDGAALPAAFQVAAVHAARPLPGDPWVVIVGESPDAYWYVRPLYALLVLFAALFAWALVRTARAEFTGPRAPPHQV